MIMPPLAREWALDMKTLLILSFVPLCGTDVKTLFRNFPNRSPLKAHRLQLMELFVISVERDSLDFSLMVEIRRKGFEIRLMERNHEGY
jgi:hypothetical protein